MVAKGKFAVLNIMKAAGAPNDQLSAATSQFKVLEVNKSALPEAVELFKDNIELLVFYAENTPEHCEHQLQLLLQQLPEA
jgi:hypothetical protein